MAIHSLAQSLRLGLFTLVLVACGAPAVGPAPGLAREPSLFASAPVLGVDLPPKLTEASGLAVTADGRVLTHNDERATVRQVDPSTGEIVKSFHVGDLHGDFEDIAATEDGSLYLLGSNGVLLKFREGADDAHVPYETFDTGLSNICELEGLAYRVASRRLILACKVMHDHARRDRIWLYAWSVDARRRDPDPWLTLPAADVAAAAGVANFHPSAVQFDPASGRMLLLAGRESALVELSPTGAVLSGRRLGARHPQPEGLAVLPDGALLIADEGDKGRLPARLTRYPRRR